MVHYYKLNSNIFILLVMKYCKLFIIIKSSNKQKSNIYCLKQKRQNCVKKMISSGNTLCINCYQNLGNEVLYHGLVIYLAFGTIE